MMTCAQRAGTVLRSGLIQAARRGFVSRGWWDGGDGGNTFGGRWKRWKLIRRETGGQNQEPASPWRGAEVTWATAV